MNSCLQLIKHLDAAHQPKYLKGFLVAGLIGLATAPKRARNANERADHQRVIALYKGRMMPSMPDHDTQNQVLRNCMKHRGYAVLFKQLWRSRKKVSMLRAYGLEILETYT